MTQSQSIVQLQTLLQHVQSETALTAEKLAEKTSIIMTQHSLAVENGIKLSQDQRQALQLEIKSALNQSTYSQGMGFASYRPETQEEQDYWTLEWWYKKANQLQQAQLENYQNAQRFLDFRSFEWFHQPALNQKPCLHGPYVDYICNGAYTITSAHPVLLHGQFIGVIAIDLLVSALEKLLMPALKGIQQRAVIINDSSRVITSNDVSIRTGTLLKMAGEKFPQQHADQSPSLQLVILPNAS